MAIIASKSLTILGLAAALCASGCVYRNGVSTCRIWADHNTLMTPALYIEETDHLPYHAARVEHYHWMYNAHTVAQRYGGGVYPAGAVVPRPGMPPRRQQPDVPSPSELPQEDPVTPDAQLPPLPTNMQRQRESFDDAPVPSIPLPILPPPKRTETDGPTAWDWNPLGTGRR